jgi:hypothetical protein
MSDILGEREPKGGGRPALIRHSCFLLKHIVIEILIRWTVASSAAPIAQYSAPYGFNDLDMMVLVLPFFFTFVWFMLI